MSYGSSLLVKLSSHVAHPEIPSVRQFETRSAIGAAESWACHRVYGTHGHRMSVRRGSPFIPGLCESAWKRYGSRSVSRAWRRRSMNVAVRTRTCVTTIGIRLVSDINRTIAPIGSLESQSLRKVSSGSRCWRWSAHE